MSVGPEVGFYAIAPTVFHENGSLNEKAVAENVVRISELGVKGVLLTGSYGEFQVLTEEERAAVTHAVQATGAMNAIMSGGASLNLAATVSVGKALFDAGASTVMVSAPFAAEMTDADLAIHFSEIGSALGGPLVVYNNPVFGVDVSPALLEEITKADAYVAVKQGTKTLVGMVEAVARVQARGQAQVLAAADLASAAAIGAGAGGVTSTNVWVFPQAFQALADPGRSPADKAALTEALQPYAVAVRALGQPRAVKAAMQLRGYAGGAEVRRPYLAVDEEGRARLKSVLAEVDDRLSDLGMAGA